MKLVYNWQVLSKPIPSGQPLNEVLKVPVRRPINELLPNQSLNTTIMTQILQSPLIPIIIAYRVDEGSEYQIDIEAKIDKKTLRIVEKRSENKSHLYLLMKLTDHECYQVSLELQVFIKYGLPQSQELVQLIKGNDVNKFVRLLSSRETTMHSLFIYQKIKKDVWINEPLDVLYKLGEGYLLLSVTSKEEQDQFSDLEETKQEVHEIVVESVQLLTWLAIGKHQNFVRKISVEQTNEEFRLRPSESYNVLFKIDLIGREVHIPYIVRWRWTYSSQVFGMLKYIILDIDDLDIVF